MSRWKGVLLLVGLAMVAVGFGGAASSVWADGTPVDVAVSDFKIAPNPASVSAGEVTFNATNNGGVEHEVVVVKTDVAHDAFVPRADNANQVDEDAAGQVLGEIEPDDLAAGTSASLTLNLTAGNYVLLCNVPGHYQLGMHVAFTVTAAAAAPAAEATAAPGVALPTTGSGGLLDSDGGSGWAWSALGLAGLGVVLFGLLAIRSRGQG